MATIVSIHSFRGGTGKSNTTANIAALLAASGQRVGVIDTDIQSPGIHVLFGLAGEDVSSSLNDFLWRGRNIEETARDVTPALCATNGGRVFLIPSSIKPGEITRVLREGYDVGLLNDGFHELIDRLKLDTLLIDTHPGLNEETLLSIAISDLLVLILRPDRQDFQGTAVTVDVARQLDVPRMLLVVNKALPSLDFAALRQQVEGTYGATVAGVFPESEQMLALGSSGVFCLHYPDHPFTQEIERVAAQIVGTDPA
jgi:septum site-determining protein MinD